MKEYLLKILSFVWDIPIQKTTSEENPYLEVVWSQGKKMLNTKHANFSFGNGYRVFEEACNAIDSKINDANDILILGFGCGSILDILQTKYNYLGSLVGVEYDQEIISLFHKHFAHKYTTTTTIYKEDALAFLIADKSKYDVVFVDIFEELNNSELLFNHKFLAELYASCRDGACLVLNTTVQNQEDKDKVDKLLIDLSLQFKNVKSINFQTYNRIIIAS